MRWFFDPLDWNAPPAEGCGPKPLISWIERHQGETWRAYAGKVAKHAASHGVARGWRQLGLRSMTKPADSANNSPKAWSLRAAPRFWQLEQVESFLTASCFSQISFTTKRWERSGTTWGFKAIHSGDQTYMQLLYDGDSFDDGKFVVVERFFNFGKGPHPPS